MMKKEQNISKQKNFLNADDVSRIFGCCKTKSYEIMREINFDLKKQGLKVYNGKVLATALYNAYGLEA